MAGEGYGVGLFDSTGPTNFATAVDKITTALTGVQGAFSGFGTSASSAIGNISGSISDLTTKLSSLQTQLSQMTSTISAGMGGGMGGGAAPAAPGGGAGNTGAAGMSVTPSAGGLWVASKGGGPGGFSQGPSNGMGPGMQEGLAAAVNPSTQGQPQPQSTAVQQAPSSQVRQQQPTGTAAAASPFNWSQAAGAMVPSLAGAATRAVTGTVGSMISDAVQGQTIGQMFAPAFGVSQKSLYVVPKGQLVQNAADYAQGNYYAMTQMGVAPGTANWSTVQKGANQFMAMVPGMSYQGAMAAQNQLQQPGTINAALAVGLNLRPGGQLQTPEQQFGQIYQRLTMGGKVSAKTFEAMMQPGAPGAANLQSIGIAPGSDAYNAFIQYGLAASGGKAVPDMSTKQGVKQAGYDTSYYSQLQATSAQAQLTSQAEPGIADAAKNLNNAATALLQLAHPLGGLGGGLIGGALGSPSGMLTSGLAMYGGAKMIKRMGGLGGVLGKIPGIGGKGGGGSLLEKILGIGGKGAAGEAAGAVGGEAAAAGGLEAAGVAADATGVGLPVGLLLGAAGLGLGFHKQIGHAIGGIVGGIEKHPGVLFGPAGLAAEELGPGIARGIGHGIQGAGHFLGSVFGGHKKSTTDASGLDAQPPKDSIGYVLMNKPGTSGTIFDILANKPQQGGGINGSVLDMLLNKPQDGSVLAAANKKAPTQPQHAAPPSQARRGAGGTGVGGGGTGGGGAGAGLAPAGGAGGGGTGGGAQQSGSTSSSGPYVWATVGGGGGPTDLSGLFATAKQTQSSTTNSGNGGASTASQSAATGSSGPTTLTGSGNVQQAYNYFIAKGLTDYQSAGVIGNLAQESGVNPGSNQEGGGPGRGIAQWTVNERWQGVLALAKQRNKSPYDLGVQLDFLWSEFQSQGLSQVKAATNVTDATTAFEQQFERAGIPAMSNRIKYAQQVLASKGAGYARGTQLIARTQLATLHRGEAVVSAADNYSAGGSYNRNGAMGGGSSAVHLNFKPGSIVLQVPPTSSQKDMEDLANKFVDAISTPQVLAAVRSQ